MNWGDVLLWSGYAGAVITLLLAAWGWMIFTNMRGRHFGAVAIWPFVLGVLISALVAVVLVVLHIALGWRLPLQVYGVFPTSLIVLVPATWFARRVWTRR